VPVPTTTTVGAEAIGAAAPDRDVGVPTGARPVRVAVGARPARRVRADLHGEVRPEALAVSGSRPMPGADPMPGGRPPLGLPGVTRVIGGVVPAQVARPVQVARGERGAPGERVARPAQVAPRLRGGAVRRGGGPRVPVTGEVRRVVDRVRIDRFGVPAGGPGRRGEPVGAVLRRGERARIVRAVGGPGRSGEPVDAVGRPGRRAGARSPGGGPSARRATATTEIRREVPSTTRVRSSARPVARRPARPAPI